MDIDVDLEECTSEKSHAHPTQKHYDREVELFKSFLDPYLKYSSGLWLSEDDSFEDAAVNMLDKIISFMPDLNKASILEIGPGWGSLIKRCLDHNHGQLPQEYVVINPSNKQNQYIIDNVHPGVLVYAEPFELLDIADFSQRFDIIVYLGSFAHMTDLEKVTQKLHQCLKPEGKVIIEDTLYLSAYHYEKFNRHPQTDFIQKDVFGIAPIPSFPEVIETAARSGLGLDYVLEHSDSYQKTLNAWIQRMQQAFENLPKSAHWSLKENTRYMELVQRAWNYTVSNYLFVLKKNRMRPNFVRPKTFSS